MVLKDLAGNSRDVPFPIRGSLFTGTFKDHSIMYDGMINTFQTVISQLEKESEVNT
jgi:hypothetical protein